jgi:glutamine synthetase
MVFTTPAPNSYRRLAPHCWSGAYQCFGPQNREAPLRLCSTPGNPAAANCELKTSDGTANPHLAAAALIVAGLLGVRQQLRLPPACALDPGTLTEEQRAAAGIARLPASLAEATAAFEADAEFRGALAAALGTEALLHSFLAIRRSEWEHFGEAPLQTEAALLYARY